MAKYFIKVPNGMRKWLYFLDFSVLKALGSQSNYSLEKAE